MPLLRMIELVPTANSSQSIAARRLPTKAWGAMRLTQIGQWAIAILATVVIVGLHVQNLRHAGPLWRDEAQTATLATLPSWTDIWSAMSKDSFPPLATLVVRSWGTAFGDDDPSLRQFGCVVGLSIVVAFWAGSLALYRAPPSIALALWGLSPLAIRYGDAVRPYGLGALAIVVAGALVGRWLLKPTWPRGLIACAGLVVSVQTVYSNAVLVGAIVLAAVVASVVARRWMAAAMALVLGIVPALSLFPYLEPVRAAGEWSALTLVDVDLGYICDRFHDLLTQPTAAFIWIWGLSAVAAIGLGGWLAMRAARGQPDPRDGASNKTTTSGDRSSLAQTTYPLFTALMAVGGMLLFLWRMHVPAMPWHFVPTLALAAACLDAALGTIGQLAAVRGGILALCLALAMTTDLELLDTRTSNVDRIADQLNQRAEPGDLIVVHPWYIDSTFHRYYHGAAHWTTLPPLENTSLHRFDLLKQRMAEREPMAPLLAEMERALRGGHRVWLVGKWTIVPPGSVAPQIAPAPHPETGWFARPYLATWALQAEAFLHTHRVSYSPVLLEGSEPISQLEGSELWVAKGWKP